MKKILITGKNSYIGTSVEQWLMRESDKYKIDTIDVRDELWKDKDFSQYDVVFHVAGIAHIKETKDNRDLYFRINRDLAVDIAKKSKNDGVKHFIFLSTMSVYGLDTGIIDYDTQTKPKNAYGKSKLEAEQLIRELGNEDFRIAIVRPPMVYGKGCKGNYQRLAKLAITIPIFPDIDNERSMIYIDNLSEFIKLLIDNQEDGLFFPQNSEYVNTSEMVRLIAEVHGKRMIMTRLFNPLLRLLKIDIVNKVFGDLVYDMEDLKNEINYEMYNLKESINCTEKRKI